MSSRESHDAFHPERLNDDRLWGMYQIERRNQEMWRERAERSLAELAIRGFVLNEYPESN